MDITSATFVKSVTNDHNLIRDELPQIAFIGRSNAGKSSLINSLLGKKDLARSSSTPGFTREANFFLINKDTYIVDLPGYGYAKGSKSDQEIIMSLIQWYVFHPEIDQKKIVLVLDAKVGPTDNDLETIRQLEQENKDIVIVANKLDKLKSNEVKKAIELIESQARGHLVIPYSSEKKIGIEKLREVLFSNKVEEIDETF